MKIKRYQIKIEMCLPGLAKKRVGKKTFSNSLLLPVKLSTKYGIVHNFNLMNANGMSTADIFPFIGANYFIILSRKLSGEIGRAHV